MERKRYTLGKLRPFATLRSRIVCYFVIALLPLLLILC